MGAKSSNPKKPKRTFADIDAQRNRYRPEVEGYGDTNQWRWAFYERMGFEEAASIAHGQGRTPRQILEVGMNATWGEITKRYRRKAMECHPDRVTFTGMTKEQADEAFKILSAAYIVLAREYGK